MMIIIVFLIRVVCILYSINLVSCILKRFQMLYILGYLVTVKRKRMNYRGTRRQVVFIWVTNVCLAGGGNNSVNVLAFQLRDAFHGGDVTFQGT